MRNWGKEFAFVLALILLVTALPGGFDNACATERQEMECVHEETGIQVYFQLQKEWENRYEASLFIINTGETVIQNWSFACELEDKITAIWNAVLVSQEEGICIVKNSGWNRDILPGETIEIGIQAVFEDAVRKPDGFSFSRREASLEETKYEVNFQVSSDWGTGFSGAVLIQNKSEEAIEDWKLEFDYTGELSFWTAVVEVHEGCHYILQNAGYNAVIAPGQTVSLNFSGKPGTGGAAEPSGFILTEQGKEAEPKRDSDGDGLTDVQEEKIGTDKEREDTDGDGLPDGYELNVTDTDPCSIDTDHNGITDGNEDFDEDGFTNLEEYQYGTNPYAKDSDSDGLEDQEENRQYGTDPCRSDTDGDGISDGDERKLGLNPLSDHTKDGIADQEAVFYQKISSSVTEVIDEANPYYDLSLEVKAAGYADSVVKLTQSAYTGNLSDNKAILGDVVAFRYSGFKLEDASLSFFMDEECSERLPAVFAGEKGLEGLKRFQIFRYDEGKSYFLSGSNSI